MGVCFGPMIPFFDSLPIEIDDSISRVRLGRKCLGKGSKPPLLDAGGGGARVGAPVGAPKFVYATTSVVCDWTGAKTRDRPTDR